ncbi:MAG: hypothetical protein DMG05_27020 [Acidobacteria bacterium]|nr:MAG: hypothetical protein DMG05_27020 [Acidobacteriota bacterium]
MNDRRCLTSKLERPLSARTFKLSCGKFGSPALEKKLEASSKDFDQV